MFKTHQENIIDKQQEMINQHMENGHIKRYQKGRLLGKGGFAQCFEFISEQTGKRYAAKAIEKETLAKGKAKQKLQSEIMIHKSLRHKHIVKFQHFFEDHENVYILLQLCSNNTLNELLKRRKILTEVEVKFYMIQIIQAVKHIHSKKIIHRDLKLGNFFLADGLEVKVGDFGLATALSYEGERRKTVCGTPNYIAPQILQGKKGHSYEVDIWSLGVIAFALLFGKPPFETNEVKTTYQKIKICEFTFPKTNVSTTAKNFISKMLKINPADRATIHQLLSDQFLTLTEIPKTLPLSTLACPPSKAFLQQIKNDHRAPSESKVSQNDQFDIGLNSSRTEKLDAKYQCLASERLESFRQNAKSRKSERSIGSITRTISHAAMLTRKKVSSNIGDQSSKLCSKLVIIHFQEHSKYGLFYLLSNGVVGMRFNDITCLITNHSFKKFKYIVLKNNIQEAEVQMFQNGQQREVLSKKMKIINHFYKQLKSKSPQIIKNILKVKQAQPSMYVVAHFNTNHYSLFWLSNNIFHAKFKDNTQIVTDNDFFTYLSSDKKETFVKNDQINTVNEDIRYKYNHISNLIKKVKKNKYAYEEKKEVQKKQTKEKVIQKQNHCLLQSASSSKLIKPREKEMVRRQFASTANLNLNKRPLNDYVSNK